MVNGYLIDTNVLSELRKDTRTAPPVIAWFESINPEDVFISVLVIGEIRKGIERIRLRDSVQATALERWLRAIETEYGPRILPITRQVADRWGLLMAPRPRPVIDAMLAATAFVHELAIVTRNTDDLEDAGVQVVNPFTYGL